MIRYAVIVLAVCAAACNLPHPIAPPGAARPVERLSELGLFRGPLRQLVPAQGFVAYEVNAPLYADGAVKHRMLYVPPGTQIHATDDRWQPPVGSYFVKTFGFLRDARDPSQGERLIETRVLVRRARGYEAAVYRWNDAQTDAVASGGAFDVPVSWTDARGVLHPQRYHVPGTSECQSCHADRALGLRTRQIDRAGGDARVDQVDRLVALGVLDARPAVRASLPDPLGGAPLEARARAYLDANCSHCHAADRDTHRVRLDLESTGPQDRARCGTLQRVLSPGLPEHSELLTRMNHGGLFHMPRGPTRVPDADGIAILTQWIGSMAPAPCSR